MLPATDRTQALILYSRSDYVVSFLWGRGEQDDNPNCSEKEYYGSAGNVFIATRVAFRYCRWGRITLNS